MGIDLWLAIGFAVLGLSVILIGATNKAKKEVARMPTSSEETIPEFQYFRQKAAEQPNNPEHWLLWGHALVRSARKGVSPSMQLLRYNEACACYRQATEIDPKHIEAWVSWGAAMYELFRLQKGVDIFLIEGGHNKFQAAIDLEPNSARLWALWGAELKNLAMALPHENRKGVLELANTCLVKAREFDNTFTELSTGSALDNLLQEGDKPSTNMAKPSGDAKDFTTSSQNETTLTSSLNDFDKQNAAFEEKPKDNGSA